MTLAPVLLALFNLQGGQTPSVVLPTPPDPERVVARVNGKDIKAREVEAYLWDWRGNEVTGDLITYRLVLDEAQKLSVAVAPEAIDKAYDTQIQSIKANVPPGQDFDTTLRQQGFPKSRLYMRVHTDLLLDGIVLKRFQASDFVRISTIAFRPKSEAATDLTAAIKRAQASYDRVRQGGNWSREVQASDDDEALKQHDGLLGWRMISAFPATAQTEFKAARTGSLTKPVQAAGAIQVFRLETRGEDAKGPELEELRRAYLATGRQEVIERLRKEAKIERLLPGGHTP